MTGQAAYCSSQQNNQYPHQSTLNAMKKIITAILLTIVCTISAWAQGDKKNQFSTSAGFLSVPSWENIGITIVTIGNVNYSNTTSALSLQYLRFVSRKVGIGVLVSAEHQWGIDTHSQNHTEELSQTDFLVMPTVVCYWYRNHRFGVYSKAAIGIDFIAYNKNAKELFVDCENQECAFQISPGGIEIGNETIRFFTELGVGHQGMINMGIHFSF